MVFLAFLCGGGLPARAQRRQPSPAEVDSMRRELQARQRQREASQGGRELVPWRQVAFSPSLRLKDRWAVVRLVNEMNGFRAVWTFEPEEDRDSQPVRVLLCWKGEQWLTLEPGRWRVSLVTGRPDGRGVERFPAWTVTARKGETYELALTSETEQEIERKVQETEKRAALAERFKKEAKPARKSASERVYEKGG